MFKRPIRNVLVPVEACNRMNDALRGLYSAILKVRDERNRTKRIENFRAVLEANLLVEDAYSMLKYSILRNLLLHLENSFDLAKKDTNYLEIAIGDAAKGNAIFEQFEKNERGATKKCKFVRKESGHLSRVAQNMKNELKRILKQKLTAQKKQQRLPKEAKK